MSFLNPVNEPVLRFKSTDAGAPQINYNSRVAGDVKAVLKACLVTGYGATASAGWTAVNEVGHVAEFVSPSAAMSDYRLSIDDTSTSSTTWYYQYQDVRVNPVGNAIAKSITNIDKTHASNGWQLLVTDRGFYFVEIFYAASVNSTFGRLTCFGSVKSALTNNDSKNIAFWCVGHNAQDAETFFSNPANSKHYVLGSYTDVNFSSANLPSFSGGQADAVYSNNTVDFISELYLYSGNQMLAQQPGFLLKYNNNPNNRFGVYETLVGVQQMLNVTMTYSASDISGLNKYARQVLIPLSFWEY